MANDKLKVLFAGSPEVAAICLHALLKSDSVEVAAVITGADKPRGRGKQLVPSEVKQLASESEIRVFESTVEAVEFAKSEGVELGIAVAYGELIRPPQLEAFKFGWVNLHFSLLPKWRGAAPVQRAIEAGETSTGVTVFQLQPGLDDGPVWLQQEFAINEAETSGELLRRLSESGGGLLLEAIARIRNGEQPTPQDSVETVVELKRYAKKLDKAEARLDMTKPAREVAAKINAFSPNPGAWFEVEFSDGRMPIRVVALKAMVSLDGELEILRVKPAGKNEMDFAAFRNGLRGEWQLV